MSPTVSENTQYLFVYGTLRVSYTRLPNTVRNLRPPQLLNTSKDWKGLATLDNYLLYDLGSYPGIIPQQTHDASKNIVHGDIFIVDPVVLPLLDEYECIGERFPFPQEYRRIITDVQLFENDTPRKIRAWIYEYNWSLPRGSIFVSDGDYVNHCFRRLKEINK